MKNVAVLLTLAFAVGFITAFAMYVGTATGPNCPAPVPAEWIGFCSEYDLR